MEPILGPDQRELEERLLRSGRDVYMSSRLRQRTLAAIAVGSVGIAAASGAKAGSLSWLTSKAGALWTAGTVGVVGAAAVAVGVAQPPAATDVPKAPEQVSESVAAPPPEAKPSSAEVEREVVADQAEAAPEPQKLQLERPQRGAEPSPSQPSELREELSHLGQVEASLKAGAPSEALAKLSSYRRRFPRPKLGLEAEILTIQALHESGSVAAAQERAARFVKRHPGSPLSTRAKRYLR